MAYPKITDELVQFIFLMSRSLRKHAFDKNCREPFSFLQFATLNYIAEEKNLTMKDIAKWLHITPPSATALVKELSDNLGLVKRMADNGDRRLTRLVITTKGQKVLKKRFSRIASEIREMILSLNTKEQEIFLGVLKKLYKASNKKLGNK